MSNHLIHNIFKDCSYSAKTKKEIRLFFSYMRQHDPNFEETCKDYVASKRVEFLIDVEEGRKIINTNDGGPIPLTEQQKYALNKKERGKIEIIPNDPSLSKDDFFVMCKQAEEKKNKLNENIAIDCITLKSRPIEPYESIITVGDNGHVQMGQNFRHIFYDGDVADNRHIIVPNGYALLFDVPNSKFTLITMDEAEKQDRYNDDNKFIINSEGVKLNENYLYSRLQCVDLFTYLKTIV
jgi:hypothetical protein